MTMVRGFCHHSLSTDPPLQVFVTFCSETGDVFAGECNCKAGTGAACSHIAALLFALEDAVEKNLKEFPVEMSRTSKPMEWHQPPKKQVDAVSLKEVDFVKASYGKKNM